MKSAIASTFFSAIGGGNAVFCLVYIRQDNAKLAVLSIFGALCGLFTGGMISYYRNKPTRKAE